jgi:PST family polysaccharide transporter
MPVASEARVNRERQKAPGPLSLHPAKQLGINTAWLLLARIGAQLMMAAFTILLARRLGEAGLGGYAFIAAAVFLANGLTSFGSDTLLVREIAATKDLSLLAPALALQLALSAASVAFFFVFAPGLPNPGGETQPALQIYSLALFPLAIYTVTSAALRGYAQMERYMWLNLAAAGLQLCLAWFFIRPGGSLTTLAWLLLAAQTAVALLALFFLARLPGFFPHWQTSAGRVFRLARLSAPIAALAALSLLYQKLSILQLSALAGVAATGWFSAALRMVEASKLGHLSLFGALFPAMSRSKASPGEATQPWHSVFSASWKLLILFAGTGSLLLFVLAGWLVPFFYGPSFAPGIPALRTLAWLLVPYTLSAYLSLDMLAAGREKQIGVALLGSLAVLAALNLAWIKPYGMLGASLATLLAECVQAGLLFLLRSRR